MLVLDAERVHSLVPINVVVECLKKAFTQACIVPPRQVLKAPSAASKRLFITMPAFDVDGGIVVKLATFFPDNHDKGLPTIHAAIVVFSETGVPLAVLDGGAVTQLRTGAASALASKYLSRTDSARLAIIGTGALAPFMAAAHCAVRPITYVSVCGRRPERQARTAAAIRERIGIDIRVEIADSIEEAVASADIVSCATNSSVPVLSGRWLKAGAFVDVVGSFTPTNRETDDEVVLRSRIFVDTIEGALAEAGDIVDPLKREVITRDRIEGELADLVSERAMGRTHRDEIILFKSVGTALEDLATARLIVASADACKSKVIN